jgi:aspartate aminotransferase
VDAFSPQGAIYLSVRFDLVGRTVDGRRIETNEDIRTLLLKEAGLGVVPFQAFGLMHDTGWMRTSIGAVSRDAIRKALPRVRAVLQRAR